MSEVGRSGPNWAKLGQTAESLRKSPKGAKVGQSGPNCPKVSESLRSGSKWAKVGQTASKSPKVGQTASKSLKVFESVQKCLKVSEVSKVNESVRSGGRSGPKWSKVSESLFPKSVETPLKIGWIVQTILKLCVKLCVKLVGLVRSNGFVVGLDG